MNYIQIQKKLLDCEKKHIQIIWWKYGDYYFISTKPCYDMFAIPSVNMKLMLPMLGHEEAILERVYEMKKDAYPVIDTGTTLKDDGSVLYSMRSDVYGTQFFDMEKVHKFGLLSDLKLQVAKDILYIWNTDDVFLGLLMAVRR